MKKPLVELVDPDPAKAIFWGFCFVLALVCLGVARLTGFGWSSLILPAVLYPKIGRNQLFDLKNDPRETKDLINDPKHAAVKKDLLKALQEKREELGDGLLSASQKK